MEGSSRSRDDGGQTRRGFRGTAENAKTKLCLRWQSPEGCRFGDRCNFAHGESELRKLPSRKAAPPTSQRIPPSAAPSASIQPGPGSQPASNSVFADVASRPPPPQPPSQATSSGYSPFPPSSGYSGIGGAWMNRPASSWTQGPPDIQGGPSSHAQAGPLPPQQPQPPAPRAWNANAWAGSAPTGPGAVGPPSPPGMNNGISSQRPIVPPPGVPQPHPSQGPSPSHAPMQAALPPPGMQAPSGNGLPPTSWQGWPAQLQQRVEASPVWSPNQGNQAQMQVPAYAQHAMPPPYGAPTMPPYGAQVAQAQPGGPPGVGMASQALAQGAQAGRSEGASAASFSAASLAASAPQMASQGGLNLWNFKNLSLSGADGVGGGQSATVQQAEVPRSIWQQTLYRGNEPSQAMSMPMPESKMPPGAWMAAQASPHGVASGGGAPGGPSALKPQDWQRQMADKLAPSAHTFSSPPVGSSPDLGLGGVGDLAKASVAEGAGANAAASPVSYAGAAASGLHGGGAGQAPGHAWREYAVPETGEKYYHNTMTGTTQWERPAELGGLKW